MSPTTIVYSELYVADQREAAGFLAGCLGFVPVATSGPHTGVPDRRSTALRNGGVTIVVTASVHPTGKVARHVDEHGDSVADLAFSCSNVPADFARAIAGGATSLRTPQVARAAETPYAVVGGFGDLRHTLLEESPGHFYALPPDRRWQILPTLPTLATASEPAALRALDHVAVCLPAGTLRDTVSLYERAFDLPYYSSEYIQVGDQGMDSMVVRNEIGGITFTMIEPDPARDPGQIDQFLAAHGGAGVQHLAYLVDDIVGAVRSLSGRGVRFLQTPSTYYDVLEERVGGTADIIADLRETNVLVDRDEWGSLLQIFTRSPYPRGTLFYELIERNGARGFGSSNIRALYEAVERAQVAAAG